ncbi:MAG: methyltransferase domain-containing protein [Gemmatimonadota bacterium]
MSVRRELQRILAQIRKLRLRRRIGERWSEGNGFSARVYPDYATYLMHQSTKLPAMRARTLEHHDERFYSALRERITALGMTLLAKPVLCLAARQGTEVRVFRDQGAFAVGIDLEPGRANEFVTRGDFHSLQFANSAVAIVFTNSMDHAFDPDRMMGEVRRVLTPEGLFIVEVGSGTATDFGKGAYESFAWKTIEDLLPRLLAHGFTLQHRTSFTVPWSGEQLVLQKS